MGLIDNHYFELSHDNYDAAQWECKATSIFARATPARVCTYGKSPIKALNEAMKLIPNEITNA